MAGEDLHPNRIPGAEYATAEDRKFTEYLVAPDNPKAGIFKVLGYDLSNWGDLRDALLRQVPYVEGRFNRSTANVHNYEAFVKIDGPTASRWLKTIWAVPPNESPHLVTAYWPNETERKRLEQ